MELLISLTLVFVGGFSSEYQPLLNPIYSLTPKPTSATKMYCHKQQHSAVIKNVIGCAKHIVYVLKLSLEASKCPGPV